MGVDNSFVEELVDCYQVIKIKISEMKTTENYVEQDYPVFCYGRNPEGNTALVEPVFVMVNIHKSPGCNSISSLVKCPYIGGPHNGTCKASGKDVSCVYGFDIPYALEKK